VRDNNTVYLVVLFGRTIKIVFNSLEELPDRCVTRFILAGVDCLRSGSHAAWSQIKVHVHNSARMTQEQQSPASGALLGELIRIIQHEKRQEETL
jgi:hypothetical protein